MNYSIEIDRQAAKFINSQPPDLYRRIMTAIGMLPIIGDVRKLKGYENLYGLRVGNVRILYLLDEPKRLIRIVEADTRGQVYKNLKRR